MGRDGRLGGSWRRGCIPVAALVLLLAACGRKEGVPPGAEPGVVARVGPGAISARELREFVEQMPPTLRSRLTGDGARREYLRSLMARHVLAGEARRRGLDTVENVARRVESRWRSRMVQAYRRDVLGAELEVTVGDVRRLFEDLELGRERLMAAIVVHSDTAAQRILARLRAGEEFEALAAEVSVDARSASTGGALGFITIHEARRLNIPDAVFRQLPAGELGPVVPLGSSFQIVRFPEDREVPLESLREELEREVYQRRRDALEERRVRELEAEYHWRLDPEGQRLLLDSAWGRRYLRRQDIDSAAAEHALYRYDGGQVSVGDYLDALWGSSAMKAVRGWGTTDSASVAEAGESLLLGQEVLSEAARRAGIAERPEEQAWKSQVTEEFAIHELRRREVLARARVTDDEASAYYQDNEPSFRRPIEAYIAEVLVPTEAEARRVKAEADGGRPLAELARELSVRDGARQQAGMMVIDNHIRLGHPRLYRAVCEAPMDEVTGPAPVEGGYSVFQVIHRAGGDVQPFAEVTAQARALARKERRDDLLGALLDRLFEQLGDQVVVYPDELAAALPDSLLGRPVPDAATSAGSP